MQHVQNLKDLHLQVPSMLTIGVFDGLHRGHQQLIRTLVDEAHSNNLLAGVMTFHPHPDEVIRGKKGRYYLTTVDERAVLLAELGVDYLVTHPFNRDVMQIRAADFVDRLVKYMKLCCLWVGEDFALGHKREGDVPFLVAQGEAKGFEVKKIELVNNQNEVVSSTGIRYALQEADLATASLLLGRSYSISGEVVRGMQRGRQLGYPTANVDVPDSKLIPANGVYASWVLLNGVRYMGATNVGYSPTFGNEAVTVETYILDFDRDIYGETITVSFEQYLRPEAKFDGLDALVEQLGKDVEFGRQILSQQE